VAASIFTVAAICVRTRLAGRSEATTVGCTFNVQPAGIVPRLRVQEASSGYGAICMLGSGD